MLVTLCGLQLYSGLALIITKVPQLPVYRKPSNIANGKLLGVPIGAIVFVLIAILLCYLLYYTVYGKSLYLMGTNKIASRFSNKQPSNHYAYLLPIRNLSAVSPEY